MTDSTTIETLKASLLSILAKDTYDINDLMLFFAPITVYTTNPLFTNNMDDIIQIITKDRDNNDKFDMNDLTLMSKDSVAMLSLVTAIILLCMSFPDLKFNISNNQAADTIFRIIVFVFLVVIPKQTKYSWSRDEELQVVDLSILLYQSLITSEAVSQTISKISAWFKSKGFCSCVKGPVDGQEIVEKKMPNIKINLSNAMNNIRLQSQIQYLERKINDKYED